MKPKSLEEIIEEFEHKVAERYKAVDRDINEQEYTALKELWLEPMLENCKSYALWVIEEGEPEKTGIEVATSDDLDVWNAAIREYKQNLKKLII
jgi:hypothetical protein